MGTNALEVDFLCSGILGTNNRPLAYGKVYCYDAGTSNLNALYSDAAKGGRTTNPIILDDRGAATGYGDGYYKFVYKDKNDVTIATYDNMYYVVPQTEAVTVRSISTDGLTTASTPEMIEVNTAGGAITLNLVSAVSHAGLEFIIVKTNAGGSTLTVDAAGAETIGGVGTKDLTGTLEVLHIMSDGSNWIVVNAPSGSAITTTSTDTLSNKTLTTPVISSFYQDAGKTKLMTTPNTASDTLCAIAATQTLTNKTLTAPVLGGTVTGTYTLGGTPTITTPTITVQAWQAKTDLTANWAATSTPVYYMKDPFGFVHLIGTITASSDAASSNPLTTGFPSGYRPEGSLFFPNSWDNSAGLMYQINITTGGEIITGKSDTNDAVFLDGITFKAA